MSISERGPSLMSAGQPVQAVRGEDQSDRVPAGEWLKAVRLASGVSQSELAAKLGFKRQAWAQFEASEARGAISLASLRRAADALGCDFSYQLVPREETGGEVKRGRSGRRGLFRGEAGSDFIAPPPSVNPSPDVDITASFDAELPLELR